ncbi:hypothetical protein BDN72DRAFT_861988 [Pluteus cervinus]|uniref:Uncharacterized protein n=1 Tax=Pluteus cervinus TaxID=181527 RepID=A0ACD3ADC7_9AGAR|nr:hypothetical protein BDN72DRAFT_861988 [Pluteus cervinus]
MPVSVSGISRGPLTSAASSSRPMVRSGSPLGSTSAIETSNSTAIDDPSTGTQLYYDGANARNAIPRLKTRSGKRPEATLAAKSSHLRGDCNQYFSPDISTLPNLSVSLPSAPTLTPPVPPAGSTLPYTRTQYLAPHPAATASAGKGFSTTTVLSSARTLGLPSMTMQSQTERTLSPVRKTPPLTPSYPNPLPNQHHLSSSSSTPGSSSTSFSPNNSQGHGHVVQPGITRLEIGASKTRLTTTPLHTPPKPPTVVVQEWSNQGAQNQNVEQSGAGGVMDRNSEQQTLLPHVISISSPSSGWYSTPPSSSSSAGSPVSPLVIPPMLVSPVPRSANVPSNLAPSTSTSSSPPASAHQTSLMQNSPNSSPGKVSGSSSSRVVFNTHPTTRSPTRSPSYGQPAISRSPPRSRSNSRAGENSVVRRQAQAAQERILASRDGTTPPGQVQAQPQPRTRARSTSTSRAQRGYVPGFDWTGAKEESSMMSMMGRLGVGASAGASPSTSPSPPSAVPNPPASAPVPLTSGYHPSRGVASECFDEETVHRKFSYGLTSWGFVGDWPTAWNKYGGYVSVRFSRKARSGSGAGSRGYGSSSTSTMGSRGLAFGAAPRPGPAYMFGGEVGPLDKSNPALLHRGSMQSLRSQALAHVSGTRTPPTISRKSSLTQVTSFAPVLNLPSGSSNTQTPALNRKLSSPLPAGLLIGISTGPSMGPTTRTIPRKGSLQNILGPSTSGTTPPPSQQHQPSPSHHQHHLSLPKSRPSLSASSSKSKGKEKEVEVLDIVLDISAAGARGLTPLPNDDLPPPPVMRPKTPQSDHHPRELDALSPNALSAESVDYEYDDSDGELHSHPVLLDTESSHYSVESHDEKSERGSPYDIPNLGASLELGGDMGFGGGGFRAPSSSTHNGPDLSSTGHFQPDMRRRRKKKRKKGGDDLPLVFARPATTEVDSEEDDGDSTEFDISAPGTPHGGGFGDVSQKRKWSKGGMLGLAEFLTRENDLLDEVNRRGPAGAGPSSHPYASVHAPAKAKSQQRASTGTVLPPIKFRRRKRSSLVALQVDSDGSHSTGSGASGSEYGEVLAAGAEGSVLKSRRQSRREYSDPTTNLGGRSPYEHHQPDHDVDPVGYSSEMESYEGDMKLEKGRAYGRHSPRAPGNVPFPSSTFESSVSLAHGYVDEPIAPTVRITATSDLPSSSRSHRVDDGPSSPKDAEGHSIRLSKKNRPQRGPGGVNYIEVYVDNQNASALSRSPSPIKYARRRSGSDGDDEVLEGEEELGDDEEVYASGQRRKRGGHRVRGRERDDGDDEPRGRKGNPSVSRSFSLQNEKESLKSRKSISSKMSGLTFGLGKGKEREKGKAPQQPDTASEESSLSLTAGVGNLLRLKKNVPGTLVNVNASVSSTGTGQSSPQNPSSASLKTRFLPRKSSGKAREKEDGLAYLIGKPPPPASARAFTDVKSYPQGRDLLHLNLDLKGIVPPSARQSEGHRHSTQKSVDVISTALPSAPLSNQHRSPSSPSFPTAFMQRKSLDGKDGRDAWGWETDGPYPHLHAHLYSSKREGSGGLSQDERETKSAGKQKAKRLSTGGSGVPNLSRGNSFNAFMTFGMKKPKTSTGEKPAGSGRDVLRSPSRTSAGWLSQDETSRTPMQTVSPTETEKPRSPFPASSRRRKGTNRPGTDAGHSVITGAHSPSPIRYAKRSVLDGGDPSDLDEFEDDDDLDDLDPIAMQRNKRRRGGPGSAFTTPSPAAIARGFDESEPDQRGRTLERLSLGMGLGVKKKQKKNPEQRDGGPSSSDVVDMSSVNGSSSAFGSVEGPLTLAMGLGKGNRREEEKERERELQREREREKALAKEREKQRQREKQREKEREKQRREREKEEMKQQKKLGRSLSTSVLKVGGKVDGSVLDISFDKE